MKLQKVVISLIVVILSGCASHGPNKLAKYSEVEFNCMTDAIEYHKKAMQMAHSMFDASALSQASIAAERAVCIRLGGDPQSCTKNAGYSAPVYMFDQKVVYAINVFDISSCPQDFKLEWSNFIEARTTMLNFLMANSHITLSDAAWFHQSGAIPTDNFWATYVNYNNKRNGILNKLGAMRNGDAKYH